MAFNFNWSPLIADTERARDMLTTALNKSPRPPIIVDDIIVNELNLGSTPPDLEILEVGDLAEDRFRGIFKMSYSGDAYLTLKTRVQANPLNTYLSTKPSFTSPQPLAANSGLTIPLQITLSDIRLSGFVILVFSKQKGITLVFRNDPLESLKVSSTFDSIPFVRDYLQRTIEIQLRVLFMEDLPAIIHRLSLRMFSPEYQTTENQEPRESDDSCAPVDLFASSSQSAVDSAGMPIDMQSSLDTPSETYASFSQKNLLRLATLTESQRTLSLFTPNIRDTVYRAWTSGTDRSENVHGASTPTYRPTTLSRIQSTLGSQGPWSSVASSQTSEASSNAIRPSLSSFPSAATSYTLGSGRPRAHAGRKRKNRVVNLRKNGEDDGVSDAASVSSGYVTESASASASGSRSAAPSVSGTEPTSVLVHQGHALREREGELTTPPRSPKKKVGFRSHSHGARAGNESRPVTPVRPQPYQQPPEDLDPTPRASMVLPPRDTGKEREKRAQRQHLPRMQTLPDRPKPELARTLSDVHLGLHGSSGGILEQAWMTKIATEVARKAAEEKGRSGSWQSHVDAAEGAEAPPAYVS